MPRHRAAPSLHRQTLRRTDGTSSIPPDPRDPRHASASPRTPARARTRNASPEASHMKEILDAVLAPDSTAADFAALKLPASYRAVTVHKDEAEMFAGLATRDKDPRKSIHLDDVPVPEIGPGEALVAVMASS
ncbi:hypothetical protein ACGFMP_35785, partial [Streptomyces sp. NPDC049040]